MKQQDAYDPTEALNYLKRVDAPPFLLTRIRQKAAEVYEQRVTPAFVWASCLGLALIFAVNAYIISGGAPQKSEHLMQSKQISFFTNNSLYE